VRISHRVTTPAEPDEVWAVLEDPSRWPEWDLFLRRVEGGRGRIREGQHLMVTVRGLPVRVPVDVRMVATGRRLGLTVHTAPGLREQVDHDVTRRPRGGSQVRVSTVLEGPFAPLAVVPLWCASALNTWMLGWRATREHRRVHGTRGSRPGAA